MSQPTPFEIVEQDGVRVASNGQRTVTLLDAGGRIFRRRGITGISARPVGEIVLPQLNELAGDLLKQLDMPAAELTQRLQALIAQATPTEPVHIEWAVVELKGVRVYVDGENVVVTERDLTP